MLEKHRLKQFLRKFRFHLHNTHKIPHITLIYSFKPKPLVKISEISQIISDVAGKYEDLRFLFDGISIKRGSKGLVLAFNISPSMELVALQRELYQRLKPLIKIERGKEKFSESLWFHAAISFGTTEKELKEIEKTDKFERLKQFLYPGVALRICLLGNSKIVAEYDTATKSLLVRKQALSKRYLSKTFKAYREKFLKVNIDNMSMRENIWFVADTHFGHKNIIKYCSRPFIEVKEMDDFIIRRWNEVVSPNDTVYILGDFSINHKKLKEYTSLLRGNKVFIQGNHDVPGVGPESMYFNFAGYDFLLTHKPSPQGNVWNIHGHVHNNRLREFPFVNGELKTINVGVDVTKFYPVNLSWIIDHIERKETKLWLS